MTKREILRATLACGFLALLFLGSTLSTGKYLSPADMLLDYYPWAGEQPADWSVPGNGLLGDAATQFEPFLHFSAERLHQGQLPLWNPDNMLGAPFVGNMQSAVFYPPNWFSFLFPGPVSLAFLAWLKLFLASLGMYFLARRVAKIGVLGASIASITYAFGAFMTVWLLHPHTAVAAWLPWLWLATALLIDARTGRHMALLATLVGLTILAGHPETAYEVTLATGLFALFRVWQGRAAGWSHAARGLGLWTSAYVLGALLGAVQILPFLEYELNSAFALYRANVRFEGFTLPFYYAWTAFSPDLYGNPAHHDWWRPQSNYNESNIYSGLPALVLMLFAPLVKSLSQRRLAVLLLFMMMLSGAIVYNLPILRQAFVTLTFSATLAMQRMTLLLQFALALLAGLGAHGFEVQLGQHSGRLAVYIATAALVVGIIGLVLPWGFAHSFFVVGSSPVQNRIWQDGLVRALSLLLVSCAILVLANRFYALRPAVGQAFLACMPLVLFLDLFDAHSTYIPGTRADAYYPSTQVTSFLQKQHGLFRTVATGWTFFPETNLMYGVSDIRGYDAMEPLPYHELMRAIDPTIRNNAEGGFRPFHSIQSHILDALNVRYLITEPGIDPNLVPDVQQNGGGSDRTTPPVIASNSVGQTFVAQLDNLTQIQVFGRLGTAQPTDQFVFHLKASPDSLQDLVTEQIPVATLTNKAWWSFTFPPIRQAQGRQFYFYLENLSSSGGVRLEYSPGDVYTDGHLMQNGVPANGDLLFGAFSFQDADSPRFKMVLDGGNKGASVYENLRALPRAWLVHRVEVQTETEKRLGRLADPAFDLAGAAMLSAPLPAGLVLPTDTSASRSDQVTIVRYEPETVQIATSSSIAGLLVLSDEEFPGWEATVDGHEAPTITADNALRSVYLSPGAHTILFSYKPLAFRVGAVVSLATFTLLAILAILSKSSFRARSAGKRCRLV